MNAGDGQNATAVRRQLVQLVATHGAGLLDDSRRVRAMLADAVAGATAEANLIGLALSSGVPAKLRDAALDPARAGSAVAETTAHLQQTSSVQAADAQWAVAAIAEALGMATVSGTAAPDTRQRPEPMTAAPQGAGAAAAGPNDLVVQVGGQERVVAAGSVATIGRDPSSTIVLESTVVSRNHARIQLGASGWEYVDLDSTQGSFVDGSRVRTHTVRGETVVTLGQGADSLRLRLAPFGRANTALPPEPARGRAPATEVPLRPGGVLGSDPSAKTEVGGGSAALRVTLGGTTRTVATSGSLSIGRETDNDLVASATTVSRHHVKIEGAAGGWRLKDLGSTSGTWLDGVRVSDVSLGGRQEFVIGDPEKGDRVVTEAPGSAPAVGAAAGRAGSFLQRGPLVIAAAVIAVLGVVGAGYLVSQNLGDDSETPPAAADKPSLDQLTDDLAKGTVLLSWRDAKGTTFGSGTVIDKERGLILTNAHVVAPAAVGSNVRDGYVFFSPAVKNPTEIQVFLSEGIGKPAQPRFTATVEAVDGYLDLAVLKIAKTTVGTFPEAEDLAALTEVPVGDSDTLNPTDELMVIGYPGAQQSMGPTFGPAVVSGWSGDERIGSNRAYINSTDVVAHGNSGGLAADADGKLVGIPSLLRADNLATPGSQPDYTTVGSAMRPVNLAKPLIEAATKGAKYSSPYAEGKPRGADILGVKAQVLAEPGDPGSITAKCNYDTGEYPHYAFGVRYEGFTGNKHTDIVAVFTDPTTGTVLDYSVTQWTTKMPKKGCMTITTNMTSLPASVAMTIAIGGDVVPAWQGTLR